MLRPKRMSFTCQVFEALKQADDFRTLRQLSIGLGLSTCRVSAALHHLYQRRAIGCLSENGQLYWYATPKDDNRSRTYDVVSEAEIRRRRKPHPHPRRKQTELPKR